MTIRRSAIPSTSALIAFECAARHCNFSRAAEELHTSQSAISRHIADLEVRLGTQLFERAKKKLYLTPQGQEFHRAVTTGLDTIQSGARAVSEWAGEELLTIACTHEVSHLFLMPRFEALQQALGDDVQIRVMTYEYDALDTSFDPRIDLILGYESRGDGNDENKLVLQEAVQAVCSPAFARQHANVLAQPLSQWGELPFLQLTKQNQGWATWSDWFEVQGESDVSANFVRFDNYVYLLESAAGGRGLALGWRGMVDRHLEAGTLVGVTGRYISFRRGLRALLTPRGHLQPSARLCLDLLSTPDGGNQTNP